MSKAPKPCLEADYAISTIESRVDLWIQRDGSIDIKRYREHILSPDLTRRLSESEMKDMNTDDEWFEGGVAILNETSVKNGAELSRAAEHAAQELAKVIRKAVTDWRNQNDR